MRGRFFAFALVLGCLLAMQPAGFAQVPVKPAAAASSATSSKASSSAKVISPSKPLWTDLTALQQQTLTPLAASWNILSEPQKRKWLEISKNYHSLTPEGQATMHSRMNEWIALSSQQRTEARLNFAKTKELSKQLTPEQKKAKWQTYQALSPEEKQKLAAKATTYPIGAAPAVKPVAPQKLAAIPPHSTKTESRAGNAPKIAPPQAASAHPAGDATPGSTPASN